MEFTPLERRKDQQHEWYVLIPASNRKRRRQAKDLVAPTVTRRLISKEQITHINIPAWTTWMEACDAEFRPEIKWDSGGWWLLTINPSTRRRERKEISTTDGSPFPQVVRQYREVMLTAANDQHLPLTRRDWTNDVDRFCRTIMGDESGDGHDNEADEDMLDTDSGDEKSMQDSGDEEVCSDQNGSDEEEFIDDDEAEVIDDDEAVRMLLVKLAEIDITQLSARQWAAKPVSAQEPSHPESADASMSLVVDQDSLREADGSPCISLFSPPISDSPADAGSLVKPSLPRLLLDDDSAELFDQLYGSSSWGTPSLATTLMTPPGYPSLFRSSWDGQPNADDRRATELPPDVQSSPIDFSLVSPVANQQPSTQSSGLLLATPHTLYQQRQAAFFASGVDEAPLQPCNTEELTASLDDHMVSIDTSPLQEDAKMVADNVAAVVLSAIVPKESNSASRNTDLSNRIVYDPDETPSGVVVMDCGESGQRGLFARDDFSSGEEVGTLVGDEVKQNRFNRHRVFGVRRNQKDVSLDVGGRWPEMTNHAPLHLSNVDYDRDTWKVIATRHITKHEEVFFDYGVHYWVDELMGKEYEYYERKRSELLPFFDEMHRRVRSYSWLLRIFRSCKPSEEMRLALITLYLCHQCLGDNSSG